MAIYNNALVIKGPALVYGQAVGSEVFYTKGDITINKRMPMLGVGTDQHGVVDQRLDDVIHEISFTPEGAWSKAEVLLGGMSTLRMGAKLINFTSASITAAADGGSGTTDLTLSGATTVHVGQYVTISTSSVSGYEGTWLVTAVDDSTHITVAMTYSATATGTLKVPPCLIIHPLQNWSGSDKILIYQYAGVTQYPSLRLAGSDTCMGEMTVSALYQPYLSATDVDSLVRYETYAAPGGTLIDNIDVTEIFTAPPTIRYAAAGNTDAPWGDGSVSTLDGVNVEFSMALDADKTDLHGTNNFTIGAVGCVATFTPVGEQMTDAVIQAKLMQMEHSAVEGVRRGARLGTSTNLQFEAKWLGADGVTPYYFIMLRAALGDTATMFGSAAARNGALSAVAVRTLSSGTPLALFQVAHD